MNASRPKRQAPQKHYAKMKMPLIILALSLASYVAYEGAMEVMQLPDVRAMFISNVRDEHAGVLDRSDSVAGVDANADGLRDDVQEYIARLPMSDAQKTAVRQLGRSLSATMAVAAASRSDVERASLALSDAVSCVWSRFDAKSARALVDEMHDVVANTRARRAALAAYNARLTGGVLQLSPSLQCD